MSKQTQEKVASVTLVKSCGNIGGRTNTRGQDGIIGGHLSLLVLLCSACWLSLVAILQIAIQVSNPKKDKKKLSFIVDGFGER